ncbi:hypothetical protein ASE00_18375 [Sphingomonas sp. Root710]|uniref:hypothetical protein n=1 Tax=Sphingomonas sp. Root710 TaxID=1736594 RepID=UPI000700B509|nr:hypothetical protein [Sphingomonas sp. Root710]KRB79685.1 hypothetical protein ASE00_18375 [Sphingomonas sp. Root710]
MATTSTTTRKRSATAKATPRKRTTRAAATRTTRAQALTDEAKTAVRSARTRATRAIKQVPTDRTSLSIAAGVIAGIVAAGVAIFMNRDKLRDVASSSGDRLKKAADDLSTMAHERIDQARDNITKFRGRGNENTQAPETPASVAING